MPPTGHRSLTAAALIDPAQRDAQRTCAAQRTTFNFGNARLSAPTCSLLTRAPSSERNSKLVRPLIGSRSLSDPLGNGGKLPMLRYI